MAVESISCEEEPCPICKGAGWLRKDVPYGHPDFGKRIACVCKEREQREKRRLALFDLSTSFGLQRQPLSSFHRQVSGVQEAYYRAKMMIDCLNGWTRQREAAARKGRAVPALPGEWLVLRGPVGTGKTHLAMAIANACIENGLAALFATVPDLLDYLRSTYAPSSPVPYDDLFERFKNAELLVLDDFGTQKSSTWSDEKVFQLLNYRYNKGWPTVITLNERVWPYLDERVRSRLQDTGLATIVDLDEARDYRQYRGKNVSRHDMPGIKNSTMALHEHPY